MHDENGPLRGEIRSAAFRRVSHGLFLPIAEGLDHRAEELRELAAWRLVLPEDAVFTHVTAASLYDWWLPPLPEFVPVFAAMGLLSNRPRRAGLICSRLDRESSCQVRHGHLVDSPEEVLLRAARDLGLLDLVVLIDSALRKGDVTPASLAAICETSRPGVRRLRRAASFSDGRAESAWETLLRLFHVLAGIVVEAQAKLVDAEGRFVARVDLLVQGTNSVHEYDGAVHDEPRRRTNDLRRGRRIVEVGVVRRGFTAPDLVQHPLVTLQEIDRAVGRVHRPGRLRRWTAWLEHSCYSTTGRRRLQNRWLMKGRWSQTA
ncbi:MAG: hypothetical protein JWO11_1345 [Nocardioides sp.]|nr:hypothetical protein [Nocardioides sp.]